MKQKLTNFFNLIRKNKQTKTLTIFGLIVMFIFAIGYSLSVFTNSDNKQLVNIEVNGLAFNMTTNTGESDDRILKLSAGSTELFETTIINLNNIDVKYELIYKVCTDVTCSNYYSIIPDEIKVGTNTKNNNETNGTIVPGKDNSIVINLVTLNESDKDYYIKLDLNAGYVWNELQLANMFNDVFEQGDNVHTNVISYVDGVIAKTYPESCNYVGKIRGYDNGKEVELENTSLVCDRYTNKWKMVVEGFVDKLVIEFTSHVGSPAITYTGTYEIVDGDNYDWKIRFLTSGTLTFDSPVSVLDVFLVGGGGAGSQADSGAGSSGGGGGYTTTVKNIKVENNVLYEIVVGDGGQGSSADGKASTAFNQSAAGGFGAKTRHAGGNGGSGGGVKGRIGASDGANAETYKTTSGSTTYTWKGGTGQGTTTREFGEIGGTLYSGGGGGNTKAGGAGGGGQGGTDSHLAGYDGTINTGGGGGGGQRGSKLGAGGKGGSGIVIIRNHKE